MATASIQSRRNGISLVTDASRDDLVAGDVVTLRSANIGTAYAWSLAYRPEGSSAALSGSPFDRSPGTFTVDEEGPYLIRLQYTAVGVTVGTAPIAIGGSVTLNGIDLTAISGAPVPGSDEFDGSSGDPAVVAASIAAAINEPLNSFAASILATHTVGSAQVVLTPVVDGTPLVVSSSVVAVADVVTEQFVRLRALTVFGDLHLVAAGEQYGPEAIPIPVDITPVGWTDEQNGNLLSLLTIGGRVTPSERVLYVDPVNGDYQSIQSAIDAAVADVDHPASVTDQWIILVRPGTYEERITFAPFVHIAGWPGEHEGARSVQVALGAADPAHDLTLGAANDVVRVSGIHFIRPGVAGDVLAVSGVGDALIRDCRFSTANGGYCIRSTGNVRIEDTSVEGAVGVDSVLADTSGSVVLDRVRVTGGGIGIGNDASLSMRDGLVSPTGSPAIRVSFTDVLLDGSAVLIEYSDIEGDVEANASGTGCATALLVELLWSTVAGVSIDGTNVGGTARAVLGASSHGAITVAGGASYEAGIPGDTILYDNALVNHSRLVDGTEVAGDLAAENVQDAIDELYSYALNVRTLDDAYDAGVGGGVGRDIVADEGAVRILDGNPPGSPTPITSTDGQLQVVSKVEIGSIGKADVKLDPNPFGIGPTVTLGEEVWVGNAPFGSSAFLYGNSTDAPTYHNYDLVLTTFPTDGGGAVGSVVVEGGRGLDSGKGTDPDAGSAHLLGGYALGSVLGDGGSVYIAPGDSLNGTAGRIILGRPQDATAAALTAAGAATDPLGVSGDVTFGTEVGGFTVALDAADDLATVLAKLNASNMVEATEAAGVITLTSLGKGPRSQVFWVSGDAGLDAALGTFSTQTQVDGGWPSAIELVVSANHEITFGAEVAPGPGVGPMVYNAGTGKLTVPGLIDPTGVVFDEAAQPATGANKGAIFVSDGSGGLILNHLYYVNAAGTATDITTGGGGGVTDLQGAYDGGNTIVTALGTDIDLTLSAAGGGFSVNGNGAVAFGNGTEVASFGVYAAGAMALQSRDDTVFWMQASAAGDKTLTLKATNAGAGSSLVDIEAGGEIRILPGTAAVPGSFRKTTLPDFGGLFLGSSEMGVVYIPSFNTLAIGIPGTVAAGSPLSVAPGTTPDGIRVASADVETNAAGAGSNTGDVSINTGIATSAANTAGNSGEINLTTGNARGTTGGGVSGTIRVATGESDYSTTGQIELETGQNQATSTGSTGDVSILTGIQNGTGATSGPITLTTGSSATNSGSVNLQTGTAVGTRGDVAVDARSLRVRESAGPSGGTPQRGHLHVDDGSGSLIQNSLYYTDSAGTQTRLNAPSLDRHHINMPEAPNNTVEYKGWASYACVLTKIKVLCATANTQGTLILSIVNNATGNTVLSANTINLNEVGSGGVLTDDTIYTDGLTGTPADLVFAVDDRWTITLTSNDPAMDAAGIYIDLTFEVS
jgi:hypothetical protein